jgi:hypothetical protein
VLLLRSCRLGFEKGKRKDDLRTLTSCDAPLWSELRRLRRVDSERFRSQFLVASAAYRLARNTIGR